MPDLVSALVPAACYLYPEQEGSREPNRDDIFVFQYWPQTLTIAYTPSYAAVDIPGATHPLYQWTGGQGRTIGFEAVFTCEVDPLFSGAARIGGELITPSRPYTVDVAAALAQIQSYMLPDYEEGAQDPNGRISAPERLVLVFPNSGLGGGPSGVGSNRTTLDPILCILTAAPITIESCFPNGAPRVATVQFEFTEVIQRRSGSKTAIRYDGRSRFRALGRGYRTGRGIITPDTLS